MYRILLPVDASDARASAQAQTVVDLADETENVTVDVLHVHEAVDAPDVEWAAGGGFSEQFAEEMRENVQDLQGVPDSINHVVDRFEAAGVEYSVHEVTGEPAEAILAMADERDSDAIVIGARRRSPIGKILFGSVAQALILDSDRPVTVAPVD